MRRFSSVHFRLSALLTFALTIVLTQSGQAQTFNVLHYFTGGADGANLHAGLTLDRAGNLYGTTGGGGNSSCDSGHGCGTVFELSHHSHGWIFTLLHDFQGSDGWSPWEVVIGANGSLYGTTEFGGPGDYCSGEGCGTIYNLRPPANVLANAEGGDWSETVLYTFTRGSDGALPIGPVIFDAEGDIYASASNGGIGDNGAVVELTPSNGAWTESVLYSFTGGNDGGEPTGGVIFDQAGNIYGTTLYFPGNQVFQLTPSGNGWTKHTLHEFAGGSDGENPWGGLIFDPSGNLYGTTWEGGSFNDGTVFMLSPSGGGWTYSILFSFGPENGTGYGPTSGLVMDRAGNLYGTTYADGAYGYGSVFKLTPSNGGWAYTSLHDFTGGSDGGHPWGKVVFDANGNLYGTTSVGGDTGCSGIGCGVAWEITP
jgi:uncharacterized repeat protein (TIGR03803 family)